MKEKIKKLIENKNQLDRFQKMKKGKRIKKDNNKIFA